MNNPLALRLGILKNWNIDSKDLNIIKGFFKALDTHTSDVYIQTHSNNIYLYLYISHIRYYSKKDNISLYKNYIKFIRTDTKINNKNYIKIYKFRFPKFQSFYILYYIKLLKLLLNNNNYNIHIIKLNHISRNTNIFLSYLTHSLSLNAKFKFSFLKIYYYHRPILFFPRKQILTNYSFNSNKLNVKKVLNLQNNKNSNKNNKNSNKNNKNNKNFNKNSNKFNVKKVLNLQNNKNYNKNNKNLHFYYNDILNNNRLITNKFFKIQKFLFSNKFNFINNSKSRKKNFYSYLKNKNSAFYFLNKYFKSTKFKIWHGRFPRLWLNRKSYKNKKKLRYFIRRRVYRLKKINFIKILKKKIYNNSKKNLYTRIYTILKNKNIKLKIKNIKLKNKNKNIKLKNKIKNIKLKNKNIKLKIKKLLQISSSQSSQLNIILLIYYFNKLINLYFNSNNLILFNNKLNENVFKDLLIK